MRQVSTVRAALLVAVCTCAPVVTAQLNPANFKVVEPSPELRGDRALSCAQIAKEMGEIMNKRGMKRGVASAKSKMCSSRKTLDAQGEERKKMLEAQRPQLTTAAVVGGPVANAIVQKTQAEEVALEARQRPERDRALDGISSGMGDMLGVMNDPRLMRLGMLAQEQSCAETMAPPEPEPAASGDGCDDAAEMAEVSRTPAAPGTPSAAPGAADPFVQRGAAPAKSAAPDPFAKR